MFLVGPSLNNENSSKPKTILITRTQDHLGIVELWVCSFLGSIDVESWSHSIITMHINFLPFSFIVLFFILLFLCFFFHTSLSLPPFLIIIFFPWFYFCFRCFFVISVLNAKVLAIGASQSIDSCALHNFHHQRTCNFSSLINNEAWSWKCTTFMSSPLFAFLLLWFCFLFF